MTLILMTPCYSVNLRRIAQIMFHILRRFYKKQALSSFINNSKSCFIRSKEIIFLGFCLNSSTMQITLPNDKKEKKIFFTFAKNFPIAHNLRSETFLYMFIGKLVSSLPAVQYCALIY